MAMNGCIYTRSKVAIFYHPRREGGKDLIGNEHCVEREREESATYIISTILKAASNEKVLQEEENLKDYKKETYGEKKKNWKEKALHRELNRKTEKIGADESWRWLKNGFLKKKTECIMLAACCISCLI